jgi:DeoR/GlpR family transcriptional regulator of sugar metabolism
VADGTKLGLAQLSRVAPLSEIDALITSADADGQQVAKLRRAGLSVTVAPSKDR